MAEKPKPEDAIAFTIEDRIKELILQVNKSNRAMSEQIQRGGLAASSIAVSLNDPVNNGKEDPIKIELNQHGQVVPEVLNKTLADYRQKLNDRDLDKDGNISKEEQKILERGLTKEHGEQMARAAEAKLKPAGASAAQIAEVGQDFRNIVKDGLLSEAESKALTEKIKSIGAELREGDGKKPHIPQDPNAKPQVEKE